LRRESERRQIPRVPVPISGPTADAEFDIISPEEPMSTTKTTETGIDPDVLSDLEAVCNTMGIVRDAELLRRVTERADRVRQEVLEKFGVQQIAAEIVREMRNAE
jgi:hypothetical protein